MCVVAKSVDTERSNEKRPWWYWLIPRALAVDGNRLEFRWVRLSDLVIVVIMCATTYALVFVFCKFGYLPKRWVDGNIVAISIRWSFVFLFLAFSAFLLWQPSYRIQDSWRANAGIAIFCLALAGVSYLFLGHGNDGYWKGQLIYLPLVVSYICLWSIPRALWRSSKPQRLSPVDAKDGPKPDPHLNSQGEDSTN